MTDYFSLVARKPHPQVLNGYDGVAIYKYLICMLLRQRTFKEGLYYENSFFIH